MNEPFNKLSGVRELPLFPLPVVLFPGAPLPLHIFEPRYREMLRDVQAGDQTFGLSYFDASESTSDEPPVGHVGCAAEIVEAQDTPDGRANIMTVGVARYTVESYVETDRMYLIGKVRFFEDMPEADSELDTLSAQVVELFMKIARAVRTINNERAALPDLQTDDPERLSFLIAAAMEMDAEIKLGLLELRSTGERLTRIRNMLKDVVQTYEERARVHKVASGNGHGGKKVNLG